MSTSTAAPVHEQATAFMAEAERITNDALGDEWLALYAPDAVAEWVVDGAYERHEGLDALRRAVAAQAALWRREGLRVTKHLECASEDTVVLTWRGGFGGGDRQFGTEIWTLEGGRVTHHQMYAYQDVRPVSSPWARLRLLIMDPRVTLAALRERRRHG